MPALFKSLLIVPALCAYAPLCWAANPYAIGADDVLLIRSAQVHEVDEKRFTVSKQGDLDLPVVGLLHVAGESTTTVALQVEKRFDKYYYSPNAAVEIAEYHSQPISVLGAVNAPGMYQLGGHKSVAEVLSLAGGLKPDAGYVVFVKHQDESVTSYRVSDILSGAKEQAAELKPGDTVTVPKAKLIYVIGDVHKPGGFALGESDKASVLEALALSEGALPTAALGSCRILRNTEGGSGRTSIPVNLSRLTRGKSSDVLLTAGDVLVVPSSSTKKMAIKTAEAALETASGIAIWRRP